jgi:RNA-directed DNA polymerase
LEKAISFSSAYLGSLGFKLYTAEEDSTKADRGKCRDSFGFLGCTLQNNRCVPSSTSLKKLKLQIQDFVKASKKAINKYEKGSFDFNSSMSRTATLNAVDKKIFGWEKSFSFSTDSQAFKSLDDYNSKVLLDYDSWVHSHTSKLTPKERLLILGVSNMEGLHIIDKKDSEN